MAFDSQKTRFTNEVWQEVYLPGFIDNVLMRDNSGLLQKLLTGGAEIEDFETSVIKWYIDDNVRAVAGYSGATTRDYSNLKPQEADGKQLGCGYDRIYARTERPGLELREGSMNKFVDELTKTMGDMPKVFAHTMNFMILGDGLGTVEASPSGYTATIAAAASSTIPGIRVNRFHKGMLLEKTNSSGTVEATDLIVDSVSVREGVGDVVIKNVGSGSASITDGGEFRIIGSTASNLGHGLDYLINNGGYGTGSANFAQYLPRNAGNNAYIDRYAGDYALTQQPMVLDHNNATFNTSLLDRMELHYRQLADEVAVQYDMEGGGVGYNLPIIMSPGMYMSLQKEARSAHQRGYLDTTEVEDIGLKRPKYGSFVFYECKSHKYNTVYVPYIPDFKYMINQPEVITSQDWGAFKQAFGRDVYEHVQTSTWQLMASKTCNSMRVDNVQGESLDG